MKHIAQLLTAKPDHNTFRSSHNWLRVRVTSKKFFNAKHVT